MNGDTYEMTVGDSGRMCQYVMEAGQQIIATYDVEAKIYCHANSTTCEAGLLFNWQDENNYDYVLFR